MADYADLAIVKSANMLDITGSEHDTRLAALNAALSRAFEQRVGRTFGTAVADEQRVIWGDGGGFRTLLIPAGLRSVASIVEDAEWDGAAWTGGTTLDAADYRAVVGTNGIAYQVARLSGGGWAGPYLVTGQWADQPDGTVPADVAEALNVLVAGTFRRDKAQDGEVTGPEGFNFKPANPWNDERVKQAIARYALAMVTV